jgi:two-component system sensor histidine kinase/response regulator
MDARLDISNLPLDAFPDAFVEMDPGGAITAWSARAEALFGRPGSEAVGLNFYQSIASPNDPLIAQQVARTLLAQPAGAADSSRIEIQARRHDGSELPVELTFFPTRSGSSNRIGLFARDISWRKELERDAQDRLLSLINQFGEEYFETDLRGTYTFANTRFSEYFGVQSGAELVGKSFRDHTKPEDVPLFKECFREVYMTGQRRRQEYSIVLNDRLIHVEHTISLKRDSNGQPIGFMVLSRDVTERKLAQIQLAKAMQAAEAASQAKSEFLANMSHEIRTPLNGVIGTLDLARDTGLSDEQTELLDMASSSANALLGVINDILDFSKIEAGKLEFESIDFEVREIVGEALRSLAVRAHQKGLELAYDIAADVPRVLIGDPVRVMQVLLNLIGNAIKFTERGEVTLGVSRPSDDPVTGRALIRFAVSDTGIGIPRDKQKLIFEAFSQADSTTTRRYGGTGLGLAISSHLVRKMSGELRLISEPGKGSTFHFSIPFTVATGAQSEAPVSADQLRGLRVLIVDDNETNRRILEKLLGSWGMLPSTADSAVRALELMNQAVDSRAPFRVVLTDCRMPDVDGFELVARIRSADALSAASIMMLTSDDYHHSAARCREMGIGKYLIKPVKHSELLAALCALLQSSGAQRRIGPRKALGIDVSAISSRLEVLLAEDNRINQAVAAKMIERLGHRVTIAANGREALNKLGGSSFDLMFMDVQMPEMDGPTTAAAIRVSEAGGRKRLPIVALTAHAMAGDRQFCLEAGMDDYISKPIDFNELKQVIARVMLAKPVTNGLPALPGA